LQLPIPDIMTNVANASMTQSKVYVQMVKEVMDFIAKKLDKIQELLQDDPKFEEKFRERMYELLFTGTIFSSLQDFLMQANQLLQSQEVEFDLLRIVQAVVPENIQVEFVEYVSNELRGYILGNPNWHKRCRKLLGKYITRIVKNRFLLEADKLLDINNVLPGLDEDILEFIVKFDVRSGFRSKRELAERLVLELEEMEQIR